MTAHAQAALDAHTGLYELLKDPPGPLVRHLDYYMTEGGKLAAEQKREPQPDLTAEEAAVLASWDYYTWPAETGSDLIRLQAAPLFSAPTYQVTGEIVQAVTGMYRATADSEPVLRPAEMPSRTGFAYLDESVTLTDFSGADTRVRALSWGPQLFAPAGRRPVKGTRVTTWDLDALHDQTAGMGDSSSVFVPYGAPITTDVSDSPTRWLHCLWLFMGTEIVKAAREQADRASRRRAERAGMPRSEITVILLRYRHYEGAGSGRDIDWSCRWVVQGHDRHLGDYAAAGFAPHHARPPGPGQPCAVCGVRTTRIRSYVKGPGGKPLKPSAKVFRVSR